jgi:hypothetical protein
MGLVTGRFAVTTRHSPVRYSKTWSSSRSRLPPWNMTTSSGSVSPYSGVTVSMLDTVSPAIGVE